jgi:putative membrane protein
MNDHFGRGVQYAPAHHWVAGVVLLVMFAVLIGVIIWAVLRISRSNAAPQSPALAPPPAPRAASAEDAALTALRMRYARGEIDRDEFVRVSSDLGMTPPPESP